MQWLERLDGFNIYSNTRGRSSILLGLKKTFLSNVKVHKAFRKIIPGDAL